MNDTMAPKQKTSALILVDVQHAFIKHSDTAVLDHIETLARSWPDDHIYWLRYINRPNSMYVKHLGWDECIASMQMDLYDFEGISQDIVIDHDGYAPPRQFFEELSKHYREAVICGADTDACVLATCFACWDYKIFPKLWLPGCTTSSKDSDIQEAALKIMMRQFGKKSIVTDEKDLY